MAPTCRAHTVGNVEVVSDGDGTGKTHGDTEMVLVCKRQEMQMSVTSERMHSTNLTL